MIYLAMFAASLVVSAVMGRLVRDVASDRGCNRAGLARHMHEKAVPCLGGIAILGSVVLVVTMAAFQ
jgi:UDP-N-acetylmuramyl pentapeptide phosphotransferase/UDP-N-acetylglucosamine-1-phosphate transferase